MLTKLKALLRRKVGIGLAVAVLAVPLAAVTTGAVVPTNAAPVVAPHAAHAAIYPDHGYMGVFYCLNGGYFYVDFAEDAGAYWYRSFTIYNGSGNSISGTLYYNAYAPGHGDSWRRSINHLNLSWYPTVFKTVGGGVTNYWGVTYYGGASWC